MTMGGRTVAPDVVARLHRMGKADRWGVTLDRFAALLESCVSHAFPDGSTAAAAERHLGSLRLEDLALAAACADGNEAAWDHFIREHRPILYRAADAIDKTGAAREAADALYGELFGLNEGGSERRSLFRYFHGRSSLATWLRAVLAQRYVDSLRRARPLHPLPDDEDAGAIASTSEAVAPDRPRFIALMKLAIPAALERLEPRDRLRLACYYAQNLTLAQIGRTLHEHEATVSRHLARTRRLIREDVERQLRQKEGMTEPEVAECFASVVEDAGPLDLHDLLADGRKKTVPDRST
jgi:RNA polymerase sigma factor (sigma-70 family)